MEKLKKKQKKSKFQQQPLHQLGTSPLFELDFLSFIYLILSFTAVSFVAYKDMYNAEHMKNVWDLAVIDFINRKYENLKFQNSLFEFHSKINDFLEAILQMESPEYFEKIISEKRFSGQFTEEQFKAFLKNYLEKVWKAIEPSPNNSFNKIIDEHLETINSMS